MVVLYYIYKEDINHDYSIKEILSRSYICCFSGIWFGSCNQTYLLNWYRLLELGDSPSFRSSSIAGNRRKLLYNCPIGGNWYVYFHGATCPICCYDVRCLSQRSRVASKVKDWDTGIKPVSLILFYFFRIHHRMMRSYHFWLERLMVLLLYDHHYQ